MKILLIGHTGRLGKKFIELYDSSHEIIGLARRSSSLKSEIQADLTKPQDISSLIDLSTVDAIVYAANLCPWKSLKNISQEDVSRAFSVGVTNLFFLGSELAKLESPPKLVIVSSIAALKVYSDQQSLYATIKSSQVAMSKHFAASGISSNCVLPNSFPGIVSTELVCETIKELLESSAKGQEIVLK